MKTRLLLAGTLLIAPAIAQDPPRPTDKPSAEQRMAELEALQEQCTETYRAAIKKAQEAAKNAAPGTPMPAMPMRPDYGPVVAKAQEFAAEFAGTDDAVQFLVITLQATSDKAVARQALDVLLASHLDSQGLAEIAGMIPYLPQIVGKDAAAAAEQKLAKSGNAAVRGWTAFARLQKTIEGGDRDSADYAAARAELTKVAEECGDKRLAQEIRSAIDLREKLGIGNAAPDIAGVDLDGVAFKLSDYRGKVVFLDFWGDW